MSFLWVYLCGDPVRAPRLRADGGYDAEGTARSLTTLALILGRLGRHDEAVDVHRRAAACARRSA